MVNGTQEPAKLEYAPRPAPYRRILRRVLRYLFLVVLIAALSTSFKWGPPAWDRVKLLYWQHECLTYTDAADRVVLESKKGVSDLGIIPPTAPACLIELQKLLPATTPTFSNMTGALPLNSSSNKFESLGEHVLFLHQRRSKNGKARLVVVGDVFSFSSSYDTCVPTGMLGDSHLIESQCYMFGLRPIFLDAYDTKNQGMPDREFHLRVHAGQADLADQSHFTIAYEIDDKKDVVDGYLQDDGSLILSCRAGESERPLVFGGGIPQLLDSAKRSLLLELPPHFDFRSGDLIDDKPRRQE